MRRVVVTGLGMVSPIGNTVEESWNNALAGKSGIGVITQFDASSFGSRIAGEVKNFEVEKYLPAKEARRFDRFIQLGIAAAVQALDDSGLTFEGEGAERAGCAIGRESAACRLSARTISRIWKEANDASLRS